MNEHLLQALQQTLTQGIPISAHMGITIAHYDERGLLLQAPLAGNTNPKGTAFAGSLNAIVTLAGWGQVWLILKELNISGDVVIQNSNIDYLRPVTDDFAAICHKPEQSTLLKVEEALRKKGKARIELSVEIYQKERIAVDFKGRYVIHL